MALKSDMARAIRSALPLLRQDCESLIETHSKLQEVSPGVWKPIPGTIEPKMMAEVRRYRRAIKACEAALT